MSIAAPSASINVRPPLSRSRLHPLANTPRTPDRTFSSSPYSSPSFVGRSADDPVILEFGARFLKAGFAADSSPLYCLDFGASEQQRAGDYRQWEYNHEGQLLNQQRRKQEIEAYELWRMDLRTANLGLIEDKIERAVRYLYTRHLVVEPRSRRVLLVLPPALPHALLSILLTILFSNFQCPNVTILSSPVLSTIAAGVRSSLVIDIGWTETVITGVFEYREIQSYRSVRAGKMLLQEMTKFLASEVEKIQERKGEAKNNGSHVGFEETEEVLTRFAWCRSLKEEEKRREHLRADPLPTSKQESGGAEHESPESRRGITVSVPLQSTVPPTVLHLPFDSLANPTETALFKHEGADGGFLDDEELPLGRLAYQALLSLPIDVRAVCMSRIVVVGGCSRLPGVKRRILDEIASLAEERGWERAPRKAENLKASTGGLPRTSSSTSQPVATIVPNEPEVGSDNINAPLSSLGVEELEIDQITRDLSRVKVKGAKPFLRGSIRGIESLGAWAGASLLADLKIKGIVEVEKDKFLQQGLWGAGRGAHYSVEPRKPGIGTGTTKGAGDRSSWTLGVWT